MIDPLLPVPQACAPIPRRAALLRGLAALALGVMLALPAVVDGAGRVTCPILAQAGPARAECLVATRFLAAVGAIEGEETLWRVAKADRTS